MKTIAIKQRLTAAKHLTEALQCDLHRPCLSNNALLHISQQKIHKQYLKDRGDNLSILPQLNPRLYSLCQEVQKKLHCTRRIDFLLQNRGYAGASAFSSPDGQDASVISINAGTIERMTDDELKWLIGHEIGHIINRDTELGCWFDAFCDQCADILSLEMKHNMHFYELLSEFEADRYGLLACGSEQTAMRALNIVSTGVEPEHFDLDTFVNFYHNLALYFLKEHQCLGNTHPAFPLRIEALHIYANAKNDADLLKQMKTIIAILEYYVKHS